MNDTEYFCYAVREPGKPGFCMITVDAPEHAKDNAKEIAKYMRKGFAVERVTGDVAKAGMLEYFNARKK